MSDTITRQMKEFYAKYRFPGNRPVDKDGLVFMRHFEKSVIELFTNKKLKVFDAGCGTGNTSISLASKFPGIEFYAVDNSIESVKIAKRMSAGLKNLRIRKWDLMKSLPYKIKFDIIICLGVLHHTADMHIVLQNLKRNLNKNGELYLWIYALPGRYRHSLNIKLLRMLLESCPDYVNETDIAAELIKKTCSSNMLQDLAGTSASYLAKTSAAGDPVWIADQFLNPHEELINMEQLVLLLKRSGMKISSVLGIDRNFGTHIKSPALAKYFETMDEEKKVIALDLLLKPERYFVKVKKERDL